LSISFSFGVAAFTGEDFPLFTSTRSRSRSQMPPRSKDCYRSDCRQSKTGPAVPGGKTNIIGFFVGQVMKATGMPSRRLVNDLVKKLS
jgi:hypothetical protein